MGSLKAMAIRNPVQDVLQCADLCRFDRFGDYFKVGGDAQYALCMQGLIFSRSNVMLEL